MEINAVGTLADKNARVDISKVHGGYFSDPVNLEAFVSLAIQPIESTLPKQLTLVDFGGGHGDLAEYVKNYLTQKGFVVQASVVDANDEYLKVVRTKGLDGTLSNLQDVNLKDVDLILMRAVLHYNPSSVQVEIINNVYTCLKKGGYFINQDSSGKKENCELRSALINLPELEMTGSGKRWSSEDENMSMLQNAGFTNTVLAGYAAPNSWTPEEQWERFNGFRQSEAARLGDTQKVIELESKQKAFLERATEVIEEYIQKYGKDAIGVKERGDGGYVITYQYPITVSRK